MQASPSAMGLTWKTRVFIQAPSEVDGNTLALFLGISDLGRKTRGNAPEARSLGGQGHRQSLTLISESLSP